MGAKKNNDITRNKKQLAQEYGVSLSTLNKMLQPLLKELKAMNFHKGLTVFTPKQIKFIYEELGDPNEKKQ